MNQNDAWYLAGVSAFEGERLAEAREHFTQGARLDPRSALAWNALGVVALRLDDLESARDALTRAVELERDNVDYLLNSAQLFRRLRQYDRAHQLLAHAQANHIDDVAIRVARAMILADTGEIASAKSELLAALRAMPTLRDAYVQLGQLMRGLSVDDKRTWLIDLAMIQGLTNDGLLLVVEGWLIDRHPDDAEVRLARHIIGSLLPNGLSADLAQAAVFWMSRLSAQVAELDAAERFARLSIPQRMHGYLLLSEALFEKHCHTEVSIFRFDTLELSESELPAYRNRVETDGLEQVAIDGPPVVLCCGDAKYFHRYSIAQILSLHETSPGLDIHIHVVDPVADTLSDCERLRAICSSRRMTFSFEYGDERRRMLQRVYYACVRYCVASELRRRTRRAIVVTDADMLVRSDLNGLLNQSASSDVALVSFPFNMFANRFSAALVSLQSTSEAGRFAAHVEAMIVQNLFGPSPTWLLDQAALYCSAVTLERRKQLKLHRWPSTTFTNQWTNEIPIWVETITHKSGNNAFTHARHALLNKYGFDIPRLERFPLDIEC